MDPLKIEDGQPKSGEEMPHENQGDDAGHTFVAPELPPMSAADRGRIMAGLSYMGVLFIVPLLFVPKKNNALQFHLRQGIVLFVVEAVLSALPFIGWMLLFLPLAASLYGFTQAVSGREWTMPFLGKYAKRIRL